jgi:hypothetical protein
MKCNVRIFATAYFPILNIEDLKGKRKKTKKTNGHSNRRRKTRRVNGNFLHALTRTVATTFLIYVSVFGACMFSYVYLVMFCRSKCSQ